MLKKYGWQMVGAAIVVLVVFLFWPGYTSAFAIGGAAGMIVANVSAPIEAFIEKLIARAGGA